MTLIKLNKKVGLIDTHCHLAEYEDWATIVAQSHDLVLICNVGLNQSFNEKVIAHALLDAKLLPIVGFHPNYASEYGWPDINTLESYINQYNIVALGEIGLDKYHNFTNWDQQVAMFQWQLALAEKYHLPVALHIRDAYPEALDILQHYQVTGIVHCFTGGITIALQFISLGFYISFSGIITFDNALALQTVVQLVPMNKIVLETDAPYLTPMPFRGKKNYPYYLTFIAQKIADLKNLSLELVIKHTYNNTCDALKLVFLDEVK